uniref:Uncharacterized protein n=1 Tax=Romanomermis culicivorax TaxID=13658 RepID=A0A915L3C1_ROMCU
MAAKGLSKFLNNRNPRNLERLRYARKALGYQLEKDSDLRSFYYNLDFTLELLDLTPLLLYRFEISKSEINIHLTYTCYHIRSRFDPDPVGSFIQDTDPLKQTFLDQDPISSKKWIRPILSNQYISLADTR